MNSDMLYVHHWEISVERFDWCLKNDCKIFNLDVSEQRFRCVRVEFPDHETLTAYKLKFGV